MYIVSFNVNGLRARLHQLKALIDKYSPDVIGLQETKVEDAIFPINEIQRMGYDAIYHGQKGHYGVALLYRTPISDHMRGLPGNPEDHQRRLIYGKFALNNRTVHIYNGYFPQGENRSHPQKFPCKKQFYEDLIHHISSVHANGDHIIVMGDMNIAPLDRDIGIGDENRKRWLRTGKCCFLPEERTWLSSLQSLALKDSFDYFHPDEPNRFSWFDYRSRGFEADPKRGLRIDLILVSENLLPVATDAGIDYQIRAMEKPSDHCPIWLSLEP
ncbi:MAG: exodeoxyribonuclease III [Porticoccus sp.]|nr:MAG: exodeoxyribonuclease III [Porticoccus sp.]